MYDSRKDPSRPLATNAGLVAVSKSPFSGSSVSRAAGPGFPRAPAPLPSHLEGARRRAGAPSVERGESRKFPPALTWSRPPRPAGQEEEEEEEAMLLRARHLASLRLTSPSAGAEPSGLAPTGGRSCPSSPPPPQVEPGTAAGGAAVVHRHRSRGPRPFRPVVAQRGERVALPAFRTEPEAAGSSSARGRPRHF